MADNKTYSRCGKEFWRVTTILDRMSKPALYMFYAKYGYRLAKQIADEAKIIGTHLHNYIEDYYAPEGTEPVYKPGKFADNKQLIQAIKNFHMFDNRFQPEPIVQEQTVYYDEPDDQEHRYAGTFDGIFRIGGKNILLDWKTSSGIWDEYFMQIEAYKHGLESMIRQGNIEPIDIDGYWVVRFAKGKFEQSVKYVRTRQGDQVAQLVVGDYEIEEFDSTKHIGRYEPSEEVFRGFLGLIDAMKGVDCITEQQRRIKKALKERSKASKPSKTKKKKEKVK